MYPHFYVGDCRPRVLRVVQGCGFRPSERPRQAVLPVHHVYHEPELYQVMPAYPEMHHRDVVVIDHCHTIPLSEPDCRCHPHEHHEHHACGCRKEF